jgi:hypothetical protein
MQESYSSLTEYQEYPNVSEGQPMQPKHDILYAPLDYAGTLNPAHF